MVRWMEHSMPFKDGDAKATDAYHVQEDTHLSEASDRLKKILDAK